MKATMFTRVIVIALVHPGWSKVIKENTQVSSVHCHLLTPVIWKKLKHSMIMPVVLSHWLKASCGGKTKLSNLSNIQILVW